MIPTSVREEISHYLGSQPKPYFIPSLAGDRETQCECWDLPSVNEEERPIHLRYQEIQARVAWLFEADKNDSRIEELVLQANELIRGVAVTKKFGTPVIGLSDLLKLDKRKGIRKEWWELHARFVQQGVRVFLGSRAAHTGLLGEADALIALPSQDPYDFLRIHETRGNNRPIDTEGIIVALRDLDVEYGVEIVSAAEDSVEFTFDRTVEAESVRRVQQRLNRLCPSAEALTEGIRLGRVALWWD